MNHHYESGKERAILLLEKIRDSHRIALLDEEVLIIRTYLAGIMKKTPDSKITETCRSYWMPREANNRINGRKNMAAIKRGEIMREMGEVFEAMRNFSDGQIKLIICDVLQEIRKCHQALRNKRRENANGESTEPVINPYQTVDEDMTREPLDLRYTSTKDRKPKYHSGRHRSRPARSR